MKAVGIKHLKAKLSEYVRQARAGETVLVTDRDEVVAELRPPSHGRLPHVGWDETLQGLADAGEVERATVAPPGWRATGLGLAPGTAQRLLDELRGDRE